MTQVANFQNFQLWPNSALNDRKSYKISGDKRTLLQTLSAKNPTGGGKHPLPVHLGPTIFIIRSHSHTITIALPGLFIISTVETDGGF